MEILPRYYGNPAAHWRNFGLRGEGWQARAYAVPCFWKQANKFLPTFYQFKNKPYICTLKTSNSNQSYNHLIVRRNSPSQNNYKEALARNGEGAGRKPNTELTNTSVA